jgi:ketosteroid isomerase-like protein
MSQENVEIVRAIYAEWEKGNFRDGAEVWDALALFIPASTPDSAETGYYIGLEAAAAFLREWVKPWKTFTISAEEIIEAEANVVVVGRQRGVGRESGLAVDMLQFHVWSFRGPKVMRLEVFRERAEALEAVGLSEQDAHADS